jgi:hypothetical protein
MDQRGNIQRQTFNAEGGSEDEDEDEDENEGETYSTENRQNYINGRDSPRWAVPALMVY